MTTTRYMDVFGQHPMPFWPWAPGLWRGMLPWQYWPYGRPWWDGRGPWWSRRRRPVENPYAEETAKTVEIKDRFGKTRYKVLLTDRGEQEDGTPRYLVEVETFAWGGEETVVSREFETGEEARWFFEDQSRKFQALARLDSRDAEDIGVYADKTGYRRIDPDCCRNCVWAKPADSRSCLFEEWRGRLRGRFFCMNSKLYQERLLNDIRPDDGRHDDCHGFADPRKHIFDVTPVVEPDGLCDGYERRPKDPPPRPKPPPVPPAPPPFPWPGPFPPGPPPRHYLPGPLPYGRP